MDDLLAALIVGGLDARHVTPLDEEAVSGHIAAGTFLTCPTYVVERAGEVELVLALVASADRIFVDQCVTPTRACAADIADQVLRAIQAEAVRSGRVVVLGERTRASVLRMALERGFVRTRPGALGLAAWHPYATM